MRRSVIFVIVRAKIELMLRWLELYFSVSETGTSVATIHIYGILIEQENSFLT